MVYQAGGGIFKDEILVETDAGNVQDVDPNLNSYDLLVPSISMFGEGPITANVGTSVTRNITITNGGLGWLESLTFYIVDGTGTMTTQLELLPSGAVLIPSSTVGDTLFYTLDNTVISEFGDNDGLYENGEQILLKRTYTVLSCDNDSYYNAYWGCTGICQETGDLLQQTNIPNLVPNLTVTMPNTSPDYCYDGSNSIDGGTPVMQTVKVQNTGNGPATNFSITMRGVQFGSNTGANYFGEEMWQVKDAMGNVLGTMSDRSVLSTKNVPGLNCVNNQEAAIVKQTATGIIIGSGETVYIEIPTYVPNFECSNDCYNNGYAWWSFSCEYSYQDQCEINNYSVSNKNFDNRAHNQKQYTVEMPTDLIDQQEFTADVYYSNLYTRVKSAAEGYNELILDLSNSNLTYNGGATIAAPWGGSLPVNVVGDNIIITLQNNLAGKAGLVPVKLKASCTGQPGGTQSIMFLHHTKYDQNCPGDGLYHYCQTSSFEMHCPSPCPRGGATPITFSLERQTRGNPDYDENHLPDNNMLADPVSINLHRAVNGDTVLGTWNIKVYPNTVGPNAGIPFNHTYVEFELKDHPYGYCSNPLDPNLSTLFTALPDAEVTIFPAGGGASISCTVSPTISGTIAKYDLSPCKNTWEGGDSIVLKAKYIANASITNGVFVLYIAENEVYSSYISNPTGDNPSDDNKYTCDHFNDYMNVFNIYNSPWMPSPQDINGCSNQFIVNNRTYINAQAGAVWFPHEYRNFSIQDEYVVDWPPELEYRSGSATFNGFSILDADVSQVGNQLIFSNLRQFYTPYGGTIVPTDEVESRVIYFSVNPSCNAVIGNIYHARFYTNLIGNGLNTPSTDWKSYASCTNPNNYYYSSNISMKYDGPLPFTTGGGEVQFTTKQVCWDVILNNGSNSQDANNSYFYLEDLTGGLSNFSVSQGGTNIPVDGNGFYSLGTNVAGASTTYTICADAVGCDTSKLSVLSGFDCENIPTSSTGLDCSDTTLLIGIPLLSEVQLNILSEPTPPITLCENQDISVEVSSAQSAYLDNPVLDIIVPLGSSIAGDITVEYPKNSGNIEIVSPVITGNIYRITLEDHSVITTEGLPGTVDALTPEDRSAVVHFSFSTSCNFVSGDNYIFQVFGDRPCGDPAIGNGIRAKTADLTVEGVSDPYATAIVITLPDIIDGCSSQTMTVDMTFTGLNTSTTLASDKVIITLPAGMSYVIGSFNCTAGAHCLTFGSSSISVTGVTTIELNFPDPIDLSTGAVTTGFSIDVQADANSGCEMKIVDVQAISSVGAVSCVSEPGGTCPGLTVITGQKSGESKFRKMEVSLSNLIAECLSGKIDYSVDVKIDSVGLDAGELLLVDVYCSNGTGGAGTYIETKTITGAVSAGNSVTVTGDFSDGLCDLSAGMFIRVSSNSFLGSEQCICSGDDISSGAIDPCCMMTDAGLMNEICNKNNTGGISDDDFISFSLNPTGSNIGTSYTVSVDNGGTITPTSGNYGNATNFQLQNGSANGTTYAITITDITDPNCTITTIVQQNSCSNCQIEATIDTDCNDNGTLPNENDDYFNLTVTGTVTDGTGNYVVKIGTYTSASTPSGTAVNITGDGQGGNNPMLAADGIDTYTVRVEDVSDSSCFIEYTVGPVDECSECPTPDCLNVQVKKNN